MPARARNMATVFDCDVDVKTSPVPTARSRESMRPLPELTLASEWFWTSGADGVLRIQGCSDCGKLVHPPVPICPYCRSRSSKPTPVSGRGTIVGFTVNAHRWLPGLDPPYVIANVALEEDPRVHLTTNIVGCDPADVQIGQKVAVRFEQEEDVWLPLFELTGELDPVDRVEEPVRPLPRAPLGEERFEHRAVLSGIGRSTFGRRLMVDPLSLAVDASLAAIADAGLTIEDIDGLSTYPGMSGGGMSEGGASAIEEALRIRPTWINGGGDLPGSGRFGHCGRHGRGLGPLPPCPVLPDRVGVHLRRPDRSSSAGRRGRRSWRRETGATGFRPVQRMARSFRRHVRRQLDRREATQYMHRYGAPREMLGLIPLNGRRNAALNPNAIYRDPMTMDDYLSARPITSPFGLYDCDVPCDGSIAVIVSAASVADDLPHPAVRIEAVGTQILERVSWDQDTLTHEPQVIGQAAHLWTRTDMRPSEVDLALVYDGFTFNAISWLEGLGFCGSARPTTGSTEAVASRSTASSRSTRTAGGSRRGAAMVSASSTKRYPVPPRRRHAPGRRCRPPWSPQKGTPSGVLAVQRKTAPPTT